MIASAAKALLLGVVIGLILTACSVVIEVQRRLAVREAACPCPCANGKCPK